MKVCKNKEWLPKMTKGHKETLGKKPKNYIDGRGMFSKLSKEICEECGSRKFLLNHHIKPAVYKKGSHSPKEGDHSLSNRKVLCKKCHQNWHRHQKISNDLGLGKCIQCRKLYYYPICHHKGKFCSRECYFNALKRGVYHRT